MELQDHLEAFRQAGVTVMAISMDSVEVLAEFADEYGIEYPLLSDVDSRVIGDFGIRNELIRPHEADYGLPYPGTYIVGRDGRVRRKLFHREYRVRETAATLLAGRLDFALDDRALPSARVAGPRVEVSVTLAGEALSFMNLADLVVRVAPEAGLHLYGRPIPDGYVPLSVAVSVPDLVRVGDPVFPATRPFAIEGLDEAFHVYDGPVEVRVPIVLAFDLLPGGEKAPLPVEVEVRWQACTERDCLIPASRTIHLDVPLRQLHLPPPDRPGAAD